MVAQSPLVTKNWAGPVKFDPGQVEIIVDYMTREIFWPTKRKFQFEPLLQAIGWTHTQNVNTCIYI